MPQAAYQQDALDDNSSQEVLTDPCSKALQNQHPGTITATTEKGGTGRTSLVMDE